MGLSLQTHIMDAKEIVKYYIELRKTLSVDDAVSQTLAHCSITLSVLVDVFNAAQLDLSRPDEEADVIHTRRNELLSHFKPKK